MPPIASKLLLLAPKASFVLGNTAGEQDGNSANDDGATSPQEDSLLVKRVVPDL
jgi:hypothetical protein